MKPKAILLASHGTPGARAAETAALELLGPGGRLFQVTVVPDFWKGMMGDDWLNNAVTQIRFGTYVENQIAREVAAELTRVAALAEQRRIVHETRVVLGKLAPCVIEAARQCTPDLIVVGSPRPKGMPGLRSRLDVDALTRALFSPLLIVPHPRTAAP
jgi:nucleotide-binding universal stress UspA family protein